MNRFWSWLAGTIVFIAVALFILSFLLDPIVRTRVERGMNEKLVGYTTHLGRAHLQLLSGTLTLGNLRVAQNLHPTPPVVEVPLMQISIKWRDLLLGRFVAKLTMHRPRFDVNLPQLHAQQTSEVPLKNAGWQQAIENIYPFKIDKFEILDGQASYTDADPTDPLQVEHLNFAADDIRNVESPNHPFPSPIRASATVFNYGRATIDGHANFLTVPSPSWKVNYVVDDLRLAALDQVVKRANLRLEGGVLNGNGSAEYTPRLEAVDLHQATVSGLNIKYFHEAATAAAEKERVVEAKEAAQEVANKPRLLLHVDQLNLIRSRLTFEDDSKAPHYSLDVTDLKMTVNNIGNHSEQGTASLVANGRFMNSGSLSLKGGFRPDKKNADFNVDLAVDDVDLTSLNSLLLAYGRFDVQAGTFSLYSQDEVHDGYLTGWVKPLFGNVEVYNHEKDKNKPTSAKIHELLIGGTAKLLKNSSTQKVATQVDISGRLDNPNMSNWQAFVQLLRNAFIRAILPGFDRQTAQTQNS
jgi:hypothetical protein